MKRIRILESGIRDLNEGRQFYNHCAEGIGDYFLHSAFSEIDSLQLYGGILSRRFGFFRMMMRRWWFTVFSIVAKIPVIFAAYCDNQAS